MSRRPPPKHRRNTSPQRLLAMGSAAAITVVAVAGAAGFGPGGAVRTEHTAAQLSIPSGSEPSGSSHEVPPAPRTSTGETRVSPSEPVTSEATAPTRTELPADAETSGAASATSDRPGSGRGGTSAAVALPRGSGTGKRVVYDISDQRVWLVKGDGKVASTYRVSGSRIKGLVAPGSYDVYSKSRHAVSYDYQETMNYMVRFTQGRSAAIGFHDIPRYIDDKTPVQTREQLGTPLSAGCIRQRRADAKTLWDFAPVGTTVVVTA